MFTRPRCRQFEPLLTAQLRLRNLIKITGINFHCDEKFSVYFTLHLSYYSKPFYTSEKLECRSKVDWSEINCPNLHISAQKFVFVRIWRRDDQILELCDDTMTDKLLNLWGVNFSGLVPIRNQERTKYKENSLLFHLSGGTFTSHDRIISQTFDTIPECQSSCDLNSDKYSTSSNFSITNGAKLSPDLMATSPPRSIGSGSNSYQNESAVDTMHELKFFKLRYVHLDFPRTEIQSSYSVEGLLKLQELQRWVKTKQESSKVLADRICTKSAACLSLDLIMSRKVFYEPPHKQPGMGRTLSLLLSQEKAPPKPEEILKLHELRVKLECARFRVKILRQQRDICHRVIRNLEMKREKLKDENTEKETMIWNSLRALNRETVKAPHEKLISQREILFNTNLALSETRRCLLKELNEIYHIRRNPSGVFTINNIHLPDAESYGTTTSPTEVSIALGYLAHLVIIVAKILNMPLRNPIKHEGSRSKIYDNIKILAPSDRIFPLFCRVTPPPNVLLYGVYLLNQNISQLKHELGMNRGDLRATLANVLDLMNCSGWDPSKHFVDSVNAKQVDHSTSSVDSVPLNIIIPALSSSVPRMSRSFEDLDQAFRSCSMKLNSSAPDLTFENQAN